MPFPSGFGIGIQIPQLAVLGKRIGTGRCSTHAVSVVALSVRGFSACAIECATRQAASVTQESREEVRAVVEMLRLRWPLCGWVLRAGVVSSAQAPEPCGNHSITDPLELVMNTTPTSTECRVSKYHELLDINVFDLYMAHCNGSAVYPASGDRGCCCEMIYPSSLFSCEWLAYIS